jgi:superfamily II DNA helicase RecQ
MGEVNIEMEKFKEAVIKATTEAGITFQLKDKQIECLKNVVLGRDSVGILPTGYGKTLIYTLLPSILDEYYAKAGHIIVVISPLVALMEEQRSRITDYGISTAYLGSDELTKGK